MDDNGRKILSEFEEHKGQFVITDDHVVKRLVAVASDNFDYYWVYWDGRNIQWYSCCGGFIPLKGKIDDKHYDRLIYNAELNHYDRLYLKKETKNETQEKLYKIMTERIKQENERLKRKNEYYLTDFCWDIN
jgi:hypothetical protein